MFQQSSKFLRLSEISSEQSGTYKCVARNTLGSETVEFLVTIKEQASILSASKLVSNEINDRTVTVSCVAKGSPLPKVSWFDGDTLIVSTEKLNINKIFQNVLFVYLNTQGEQIKPHEVYRLNEKFHAELSKEDENVRLDVVFKNKNSIDFKNLNCKAENFNASKPQNIKLDELEEIKSIRFSDEKGDDVRHEVQLGQQLELNCKVKAESKVSVRWIFVSLQIYFYKNLFKYFKTH